MKTEPAINIQSEVAKIHSQFGMTEIANYRIEKLFEMYVKQSSPRIKQLEWEEYENLRGRKSYFAKTQFSPYSVEDGGDHYTMFSPDKRLRFASADKAKAAAQADFEKRVMECLDMKEQQKQALIDMMRGDEELGLYDE